ncbi:MAG: type II secretion system protein GspG [Planctomycetes bacterium]|nr:type II secretion system protein GspG [Planctomycetota bacterium]
MSEGQRTNGLGVAGFVVSLLGLVSCGLISPIGLVMSAVAMKREPKGLAIAGFVIGLIGSLWLIPLFAFGLLGVFLPAIGAALVAADKVDASVEMSSISVEVRAYVNENGSPPEALGELSLDTDLQTDPWGNPYRYLVDESGTWTLSSDGADGVAGTDDDIHSGD